MNKYKVLKDFVGITGELCKAGEKIMSDVLNRAQTNTLIENNFIKEIPEKPHTLDDLKEGDDCYQIQMTAVGAVATKRAWSSSLEHWRDMGLVYLTKEECEKEISRSLAEQVLLRDAKYYKAKAFKSYYYVEYSHTNDKLDVIWSEGVSIGSVIPFENKVEAELSMEKHEAEWKTYLGVEE